MENIQVSNKKFIRFKFLSAVEIDGVQDALQDIVDGKSNDIKVIAKDLPSAIITLQANVIIEHEKNDNENAAKSIEQCLEDIGDLGNKAWYVLSGWDFPVRERDLNAWRKKILDEVYEEKSDKFQGWKFGQRLMADFDFANIADIGQLLKYDEKSGSFKKNAKVSTHTINEITAQISDLRVRDMTQFNNPPNLINLQNGTFNIDTMEFIEHSPDYKFRNVLPVRYDPMAIPRRFLRFLEFATKDDPIKGIRICEMFAFSLMSGYPIKKAVILYGDKDRGKTTILDVLNAFLGEENISHTPLQTIAENRFAVAGLMGKLANISGDVGKGTLYDTSVFKQLTGDDRIEGEIKGLQERPRFWNRAKLIFGLNTLPISKDQTDAYYSRFELIPMMQDVTKFPDMPNVSLKEWLTDPHELSGILNLVLHIFLPALRTKRHFEGSQNVDEIRRRYDLNANPVYAFAEEALETDDSDNPIETTKVYEKYQEWSKASGLETRDERSFGYWIIRSAIRIGKKREQKDGRQHYYYTGIKINEEAIKVASLSSGKTKDWQPFPEVLKSYVQRYDLEGELLVLLVFLHSQLMEDEDSIIISKSTKSLATLASEKKDNLENKAIPASGEVANHVASLSKTLATMPSPELTPTEKKIIEIVKKSNERLSPKAIYDKWDITSESGMPPDMDQILNMGINLCAKTDLKYSNGYFFLS